MLGAQADVFFLTPQGMAPTLMVVRAACTSPKVGNEKSRTHLSDLEFRAQSMGVNTSSALSGSIQVQLRTADNRASLEDEKAQNKGERI